MQLDLFSMCDGANCDKDIVLKQTSWLCTFKRNTMIITTKVILATNLAIIYVTGPGKTGLMGTTTEIQLIA